MRVITTSSVFVASRVAAWRTINVQSFFDLPAETVAPIRSPTELARREEQAELRARFNGWGDGYAGTPTDPWPASRIGYGAPAGDRVQVTSLPAWPKLEALREYLNRTVRLG